MHVKLLVSGGEGEVYIDSDEPVVFMHELFAPPPPVPSA